MTEQLLMNVQLDIDASAGSFVEPVYRWIAEVPAVVRPDVHPALAGQQAKLPTTSGQPGAPFGAITDVGAFVRALLPVRLTGGHTITFGVWIAIDPAHLQSVFATWWEPEYQDLRMAGWLANAISPWGLLSAPVQTVVRNADETPYCDSSSHPQLDRVLHEEWPHDLILPAVDSYA